MADELTETLRRSGACQLAGDLAQARGLCEHVLEIEPHHAEALFRLGLLELAEARPRAALGLMERAIAGSPASVRYGFGRGQALSQLGRHGEAAQAYRDVLASEPTLAEAHCALGEELQALGEWAAAASAYRAALEHAPAFPEALNNLGNCHRFLGEYRQALHAYSRAVELRPNFAGALGNMGLLLHAAGRAGEALAPLARAVGLEPAVPSHLVNLGAALCALRRFGEAIPVLEKAGRLDPSLAQVPYNLGNALLGLGRAAQAAEHYRAAVALKPDFADAHNNLGNACREAGDAAGALAAFEAAMRSDPGCTAAFNNASGAYRAQGRLDDAERVLREALSAAPSSAATLSNLGNVLRDRGELDEALGCFRRAVAIDPTDALAHSNLAYTLCFHELEGRPILDECLRWDARHGRALAEAAPPHGNSRDPDRRLRVGYVSGDLREHCTSLFTLPLLRLHDRSQVEVFAYSSVERPDAVTRRFEGHADRWRNVRALDDRELAEVIRADGIDILVDLGMHMANGRPQVFARRPAPVQVAWVAYPGTTGMRAMDAVFSDPRLAPPELHGDYSERVVALPDTFWCYDPETEAPPVSELPALAAGRLTLGCLNTPCKISDRALEMWGAVMRELPGARLFVMAPHGRHRGGLLERMAAHGIAPGRVELQPFRARSEYLATYHRIDLALDTFPYNGHTTSLDSFWMGVPVVTRVGRTSFGRAGLSQLHNLGLTELAGDTDARFAEIAVGLARDLPRLARLRAGLRARMEHSPLTDTPRFARGVESAYRDLWRRWCAGGSGTR